VRSSFVQGLAELLLLCVLLPLAAARRAQVISCFESQAGIHATTFHEQAHTSGSAAMAGKCGRLDQLGRVALGPSVIGLARPSVKRLDVGLYGDGNRERPFRFHAAPLQAPFALAARSAALQHRQ
jgi:hypothetical protein